MNSDPNDFEALRKLIALKRHEQPPPGYFNRLPDRIAARLERGEGQLGFWERVLGSFTFRPAFVYGFSMAALSALTLSVIYSVRVLPNEFTQRPLNDGWRNGTREDELAGQYNPSQPPLHLANWKENINASNPAPLLPSLFEPATHYSAIPVSFAGSP
jgi:hypothetical protein